jgi:hypothetical protein
MQQPESFAAGASDSNTDGTWLDIGDNENTESTAGAATAGVDGTVGVPSNDAFPAGRDGAAYWTGPDGMFYIYGGFDGTHTRSDLWKFNPYTRQYTMMVANTDDLAPTYSAVRGTADASGTPGSRRYASTAVSGTDASNGKLWLVGGRSATTDQYGDVWYYSLSLNQWVWKAGSSTINVAADLSAGVGATTIAGTSAAFGARQDATTFWTGGKLYLFGGQKADSTNNLGDTWSYDPTADNFAYILGPAAADTHPTVAYPAVGSAGSPMFRVGAAGAATSAGLLYLIGGKCNPATGTTDADALFPTDVWTLDTTVAVANMVWTLRSGTGATVGAQSGSAIYSDLRDAGTAGLMPGRWRAAVSIDNVNHLIYIFGGAGQDTTTPATPVQVFLKDVWTVDTTSTASTAQIWVGGQSFQDSSYDQTNTAYYSSEVQVYGLGVMAGVSFVDKWSGYYYGFGGDESGLEANDLFYIPAVSPTLLLTLSTSSSSATVDSGFQLDTYGSYTHRAWISNNRASGSTYTVTFTVTDGSTSAPSFSLTLTWATSLNTEITAHYSLNGTTPLSIDFDYATSANPYVFTVPFSPYDVVTWGTLEPTNNGLFYIGDSDSEANVDPARPWLHQYTVTGGSSSYDSEEFRIYPEDGHDYEYLDIQVQFANPPSSDNTYTAVVSIGSSPYYYDYTTYGEKDLNKNQAGLPSSIVFTLAEGATISYTSGNTGDSLIVNFTSPAAGQCWPASGDLDFTVTAADHSTRDDYFRFCTPANNDDSFIGYFSINDGAFTTWIDTSGQVNFADTLANMPGSLLIVPADGAWISASSWANNDHIYNFTLPALGQSGTQQTFTITAQDGTTTQAYSFTLHTEISADNSWSATLTAAGLTTVNFDSTGSTTKTINIPRDFAGHTDGTITFTLPTGATINPATSVPATTAITTSPYTFTFPAIGATLALSVSVKAEDGTIGSMYTLNVVVVANNDNSWTAVLSAGGLTSINFDSTLTTTKNLNVAYTFAAHADGVITFTLPVGATIVTTNPTPTITASPYTFTFPATAGSLSPTFQVRAEDGTLGSTYTININVAGSPAVDWSATLTGSNSLSQLFDSLGSLSQTVTIPRVNNGGDGTITISLPTGATLISGTGTPITTTPYHINPMPAPGASTTRTITVRAQDGTTTGSTYTITFTVTADSNTAWTAVLAVPGMTSQNFDSAGSTTINLPITNQFASVSGSTITFTLAGAGATVQAGHTITSTVYGPFATPSGGNSVSLSFRVQAESGALGSLYTININVAASTDASWSAVVTVGGFTSDTISSNGHDNTDNVLVPWAYRHTAGVITITKALIAPLMAVVIL